MSDITKVLQKNMGLLSQSPIPEALQGGLGKRYSKNEYEAEADKLTGEVMAKYGRDFSGEKFKLSLLSDQEARAKLRKADELRQKSNVYEQFKSMQTGKNKMRIE